MWNKSLAVILYDLVCNCLISFVLVPQKPVTWQIQDMWDQTLIKWLLAIITGVQTILGQTVTNEHLFIFLDSQLCLPYIFKTNLYYFRGCVCNSVLVGTSESKNLSKETATCLVMPCIAVLTYIQKYLGILSKTTALSLAQTKCAWFHCELHHWPATMPRASPWIPEDDREVHIAGLQTAKI